ncbi:MAG: TIGR02594 family protein [Deltaproteobacteria bacterium]|nr:TIGR02594 family protein [Candidatus Desulfobacula maris]
MNITAFDIAERFQGVKEVNGALDNPVIMSMLTLDNSWPQHDEIPWCSAFVNYICWLLRLPRSKSLMARSWIRIGSYIELKDAEKGLDVVVLKRELNSHGPEVLNAQGHVGFYAGHNSREVFVLGGNQGDAVNVAGYDIKKILAVRRLI